MDAVGRLGSAITRSFSSVWGPFHPFGGAIDIIVVQQQDGSFKSSPWHVKFGKFQGVLKTKEKIVNVSVNGVDAGFHMYLNHKGEAYFANEVDDSEENSSFSPASSTIKTNDQSQNGRNLKDECFYSDKAKSNLAAQVNVNNEKILVKTNSRPSRDFEIMSGQKSMKDGSRLKRKDIRMERISSLERAEYAADLLETKWSTNIPTNDCKMKFVSQHSAQDFSMEVVRKDVKVREEHVFEVATIDSDESHIKFLEPSTFEASDSTASREIISEQSEFEINNVCEEDAFFDVMARQSASQISSHVFKDSPCVHSIDFSLSKMEQVSCKSDFLKEQDIEEEYRASIGSSNAYTDAPIISNIGIDVYGEVLESLDILNRCSKEDECSSDISSKTSDLVSEDCSELVPVMMLRMNNPTNCNGLGLGSSGGDYSVFHDSDSSYSSKAISENSLMKSVDEASFMDDMISTKPQSHKPTVICMAKAERLKEAQDIVVERVQPDRTSKMDEETCDEEAQLLCTSPHSSNAVHHVQQVENPGKDVNPCVLPLSAAVISLPEELGNSSMHLSDALEDVEFSTGNIHDLELVSVDVATMVKKLLEDTEDDDESDNMLHETSLFLSQSVGSSSFSSTGSCPEGLVQESPSSAIQVSSVETRIHSSPICIPTTQTHKMYGTNNSRSLPNIWSHTWDLECCQIQQPLSRSLDVCSSAKEDMLEHDLLSTSRAMSNFQSNLAYVKPGTDISAADVGILMGRECGGGLMNPVVELSLCKHLLFEGMGAEAASQAFYSEKLDLEKFRALGPSILEDDRLIARVGRLYFPWVVAAPLILGLVSFDQEFIFEPQGMIAVETKAICPLNEVSKTVVPSDGGWKLWPFRFKKMEEDNSSQISIHTKKRTEVSLGKSVNKNNVMRRKILKCIVPTSEQLASLNLKDGQNDITFTFSTAMLGKQQVDARIFLWKWNARIVVSDVDGTITKSDILGQFMPLVGKDWSQTGVAHLFSAIEENGYQLLFLSARAISQASLTRQFLFNLKQDGKVLPEGPVVISPDGLFPSLFREVIRRAPHEFKIACLESIRALFPPDSNPFYAGFGNRATDEISYIKVGIPKGKIFTINPKGEVVVNRRLNTKSYTSLHALVNGMFPPMISSEQEDFNSWNYWRMPLPDLDI